MIYLKQIGPHAYFIPNKATLGRVYQAPFRVDKPVKSDKVKSMVNSKKRGAFFIDRDGVINQMVYYKKTHQYDSPQKPQDVKLVKGTAKLVEWFNKQGILVVEISNQPGVAKGKMTQPTSDAIEARAHHLLAEKGARIDKVYICPHHPRGKVPKLTKECRCKKPKPGLLLQAAQDLNINLAKSVFLGDKASDVEAGQVVGCQTIILLHDQDLPEKVAQAKKAKADYKIKKIREVIPILKKIFKT